MGQIANPTSVTLSTSNGVVYLSWTNGDAYTSVIIYRNTSNSQVKLTEIDGAPTSFQDQPGSGTFYYWVQGHIYIPGYTDDYGIKYPAQNLYSDAVASSPAYVTVSPPGAPSIPTLGILTTTSVPMKIVVPCSGGGSGTLGYKIERSTDGTNYTQIATAAYTGSTVNYEDKDINPSTLYYYRIKAYNDYGESSYSSASSITSASVTVPGTPSISLTAGNASIVVTITPGSDQSYPRAGFQLAWSTSSPPTSYLDIGNTTYYTITGLTNGTLYYVRCKQIDNHGNASAESIIQSATPSSSSASAPSPPGMPTVQLASKDSIHVSWSPGVPPSGQTITYYKLYVFRPGASSYTLLFWTYGLDYIITSASTSFLTKGTLYYCVIVAGTPTSQSTYSPPAYFYYGPAAMGTISMDQLANNIMKLKWVPVGGADFYLIERREARQSSPGTWGSYSSYIPIANVPAVFSWDSTFLETYVDNTLQAGVKYQWRITPYDRYGNTNTSAESAEIIVGGQAISDPDWCEAEEDWDASGNPIIHVSWSGGYVAPPRQLSKYQITRNSSPSLPGPYIVDVDGTITQFTDTGTSGLGSIQTGTTYYYGVRTKDDLGNVSDWEISNAVQPRVPSPPPPPTNLVAYAQGNSIVVTWTPDPGADATILYRSTDGSSYSVQHAGASTTLSSAASAGATSVTVTSYSGLARGDFIYFEDSGKEEIVCITATVTGNTISVTPLHYPHSSGVSVKKVFTPTNSKYTETGTVGTKLYFKAKSANNYLISSSFSNVDYAIIGEPSRPTAQASVVGNDIVVTWSKSVPGNDANTIAYYRFYWRLSGGTWSSANQVSGTSANLSTYTTVQQNVYYEFKVEAVDSAGLVSEASPIVTCGIFKPNPPTNLVAFAQQESGVWYIFVQWSAPEQTTYPISYYKLYRKPEGGNFAQVNGNIYSTVYKDAFSGLTAGTRYYYYVIAYDTQGLASISSNIDSAVVGEPGKPSNVRAIMGDGQVTVYWSASMPGAAPLDHYHVWMSTDGTTFSKVGDNLNADPNAGTVVTQYTQTGLNNGQNYWFKVSVIDKARIESEYSETVQTRPYLAPNPPRNVQATAGHLEIHLSWDKPEE